MSLSPLVPRDASLTSVPAQVFDAMAVAARAYDRLADAGETLQFTVHPWTGRLTITLADLDGNPRFEVSPSTVLDVAAGGDPDTVAA